MKILLFTPNFLPSLGGAERVADTITRRFIDRGHEVRVLCQWSEGQTEEIELPYPVIRYHRPSKLNWWPERLGKHLKQVHRAWRFDAVLAFYAYPTGYVASRLKRSLGFKLVITPRGGDLYPAFHGRNKLRVRKTIAAGYRNADRIVSISDWLTQRIVEETGRTREQLPPIDKVANGIDLEDFDQRMERSTHADKVLPVMRDPFILQIARLHPVKQQEVVIEAVHKLRHLFEERGMKLSMVGGGPSRDSLKREIDLYGLKKIVYLLGKRTGLDKHWLLNNASAFVTASREEGLPNAVLEAMAAGLPTVASDIGPHRELIEGKGWGRLFKTGNADDLAAQLKTVLEADPAPMRDAALKLRENYTLSRMIDGYEQALQAALSD